MREPRNSSQQQEAKRSMIENLEHFRRASDKHIVLNELPANVHHDKYADFSPAQLLVEVRALAQDLRQTRANNALLEDNLRRMENHALEAIVESGVYQRQLGTRTITDELTPAERETLLRQTQTLRDENFMLTQALIDSENEITRLTRTLEKFAARFA